MINKEELEELYWGEPGTEMGAFIIADKLGCSRSKVYRHLRKYNIPVRPPTTESNECMTKASVETASRKCRELHRSGVLDMSGENSPNYGRKASAETRKKMSEANKEHLNGNALEEDRALEIYHLYKNTDISLQGLKEKYKHSSKTIHAIISCKHWATKDLTPVSKSCGQKGMSNHKAKIDKKTGLEIYDKYKTGEVMQKELAKEYGVSLATINLIVHCNHWITEDLKPIFKNKKISDNKDLINKKIGLEIYNKYKNNDITKKDLANNYGVSPTTINRIIKGKHPTTKGLIPILKTINYKKGKFHHNSKLDRETGLEIYNKYKNSNLKRRELANNYGVSIRTIGRIVNCKHWTTEHLSDD